mmetsp:Transcript_20832/g.37984  ORF Transcript_20832/g.37984 Transcript_20832/m.37984 type:complete len:229 (+) Transcript_20832:1642-2328(+)
MGMFRGSFKRSFTCRLMAKASVASTSSWRRYCWSWTKRRVRSCIRKRLSVIMDTMVAVSVGPITKPSISTATVYARSRVLLGTTSLLPGVICVNAQCNAEKYIYQRLGVPAVSSSKAFSQVEPVSLSPSPSSTHIQLMTWHNASKAQRIKPMSKACKEPTEPLMILHFSMITGKRQDWRAILAPNATTKTTKRKFRERRVSSGSSSETKANVKSSTTSTKSKGNQRLR